MKFILGSTNSAKVNAAERMLQHFFPESTLAAEKAPSGVSAQPLSDDETRTGAINRAVAIASKHADSYGIGLEGGVRTIDGQMYLCNWGALVTPTSDILTAGGAQIPLPEELANEIRNGKELGDAVDAYFQKQGIRHSEGAMGMLTAQAVKRDELFEHILKLLLGQLLYSRQHKG